MTYEQAKNLLRNMPIVGSEKTMKEDREAVALAIDAIMKQMPKKVNSGEEDGEKWFGCPTCGRVVGEFWHDKYDPAFCPMCGQALDWSVYEQ